jgi:hypothetical protein
VKKRGICSFHPSSMAPIRLKTWVPRNTKPTYTWKARNSEEMGHFNAAFANKEYVQNIVGQILKDLKVREWSEWEREDLAVRIPSSVLSSLTHSSGFVKRGEGRPQALVGRIVSWAHHWTPRYLTGTPGLPSHLHSFCQYSRSFQNQFHSCHRVVDDRERNERAVLLQ